MSEVKLSLSIDTWKDIPNYEGLYQIDKEGNVKSTIRHGNTNSSGILKQRVGRGGYRYVKLSKNGKVRNCTIHRLVALTFIENPNNHESDIEIAKQMRKAIENYGNDD